MSAVRLSPEVEMPASNAVFFLFDTLFRELASEQERQPLEHEERFQKLKLALETQLLAFVREELHLPVAAEVHEVDLNQWLQGKLKIYHPRYSHFDLLEVSQNSLDFNSGRRQERYRRESQQVEQLYQKKLTPDLENVDQWTTLSADQLPFAVRQVLSLNIDEIVYVGKKHALFRPANLEVYPDGYSYINLYQLIYLPKTKKVHLIEDFLYDELSLEDHQRLSQQWDPNSRLEATENSLMSQCITLPEELRLLPGFSLFEKALNTLQEQPSDALNITLREKQQARLGRLNNQEKALQTASTFLTHILMAEYTVCQENSSFLTGLAQRLQVAFEMVAHPLVTGAEFQYEPSLKAYQKHVLPDVKSWRNLLSLSARKRQNNVYQELNARRHELRNRRPDQNAVSHRDIAFKTLSKDYPAILGRVSSVAQCSLGSFGGLTQVMQQANTSLGQSVLQGHLLNKADLSQLIGEKRAQEWKVGHCINPHCKNGGARQLVGECSLCYRCEMESNLGELPFIETPNSATASDRLQQLLTSNAGQVSHILNDMSRVSLNELPTFLLNDRPFTPGNTH